MIPEEAISTAEGHEDPDTQPTTMDVTSDSPQPMSPNQADALDRAVLVTIHNDGRATDSVSVTPLAACPRKSRLRERTSSQREDTRTVELTGTALQTTSASIPAMPPPPLTLHESKTRLPKGRGILRLKAPPKVGRDLAPERQPLPVADLPLPQWAIHVPPPPTVEYRAATPPLEDSQLFASQPESSQVPDLDEDYRPLTGLWSDIVEREEQAISAAAAAVSAALATLPEPVAAINATIGEIPMPPVISTVPTVMVTVVPMPMASLLLGQSTNVASTTTVSAMVTGPTAGFSGMSEMSEGANVAAASSAADVSARPDTRRLLNDQDISYAVRLAPTPDAAVTTDALMTSFRMTMTHEQLLHTIQLLFDVQHDTSVFLMERITVARLTDRSSNDILDEILSLLRRFTIGTRRQ